jgi:hypothetical protein
VPLELRAVDVKVNVLYKNNGYAEQTLHLNVAPSPKGLFSLTPGLCPLQIDMMLADEQRDREEFVRLTLTYDGLGRDIYPTLDQLNYSVDRPEDNL